jgi:hypothetical protein
MNMLVTSAIAAIVPLILGFIWYHPKVFGTAWMNATGLTQEEGKSMNMPLVFGLTYVVSFLLAIALHPVTIHQMGVYSLLANEPGIKDPNSPISMWLKEFMTQHGNNFRTFKHGALHGGLLGVFALTPVITVNALFERRGFKYIAITAGYWIIAALLMGGIVCQFTKFGGM